MAIWIYPKHDKAVIEKLLEAFKGLGEDWKGTELSQSSFILEKAVEYPQYLATLDPMGIGGDKCHLWRDGQTWWPMSGDFSSEVEEQIEQTFKTTLETFLHRRDSS